VHVEVAVAAKQRPIWCEGYTSGAAVELPPLAILFSVDAIVARDEGRLSLRTYRDNVPILGCGLRLGFILDPPFLLLFIIDEDVAAFEAVSLVL
jgi:hypothetical protein